MSHGGCCNCFICKLGVSLGLMEGCKKGDSCCKVVTKKKAVKKSAKKKSKVKRK